ncbi:MAG TPA: alpha/beta fold hydrolase [Polyangiaceae bacterium]|nr:alpha/beta fold hydrolase [Polyangiaceae bacterium]
MLVIPGIEDAVLSFEHVPWFWAWHYRPLAERGRRVVVLGRPRGLGAGISTEGLARTYADVIDRHLGPVNVVGISMGGLIAQHLAASRPELVRRLALAVTATGVGAGGISEGERLAALAGEGRWRAFMTESNRICFTGFLRAFVVLLLLLLLPFEWLLRVLLVGGTHASDFRISAEACRLHDGTALLESITVPTLVWGANDDCLFPRESLERMASALPRGELAMTAGAHAAFLQERSTFHAALDAFFAAGDVPRGRETDVEVAIVGSGFSGLGMAIRLKQEGRGSFMIFEKGSSIGGTWRDNDYPGCACDVPSHLYSFSFEQNPSWTRRFAPQSELRQYLDGCVEKYGLRRHIKLDAEVTRVEFDDRAARWTVSLADGNRTTARHVVFGIGALSRPAYPKLDGIERFAGRAFHSASWDHSYDLDGKRVAVVGTGASAIQIVPGVARRASKLSVFQRTPPWVLPKPDRAISGLERRLFRASSALQNLYRFYIYISHELRASASPFIRRSCTSPVSSGSSRSAVRSGTPSFAVASRRITCRAASRGSPSRSVHAPGRSTSRCSSSIRRLFPRRRGTTHAPRSRRSRPSRHVLRDIYSRHIKRWHPGPSGPTVPARMANIPYPATASDHELNLMRMLSHSPPALEGFRGLGAAILGRLALSPRLREVAILRTGMLGAQDVLDAPSRAIVKLADELHAGARGKQGDPGRARSSRDRARDRRGRHDARLLRHGPSPPRDPRDRPGRSDVNAMSSLHGRVVASLLLLGGEPVT